MALAGKKDKKNYRVYTVMGDGELAEGSVWEGFMAAHQYKLDNLCAVVDRNRLQISGNTEDVMGHDDLVPVSYTHLDVYKRQSYSRSQDAGRTAKCTSYD